MNPDDEIEDPHGQYDAFIDRVKASAERWLANPEFRAELDRSHVQAMDRDPHVYIEVDGELMGFWLPEDVDPDGLGIEWVKP